VVVFLPGMFLRTAHDFDSYYQSPDPWKIGNASRRDKALSRIIGPYVAGKTVLELGCGEGHLTASIFRDALSVKGVDISPVAYRERSLFPFRTLRFRPLIF
jgi:2-polyprenyl-3-methyl-5-hydroxy-6-metoxy-1,4-benzoquinol methylase